MRKKVLITIVLSLLTMMLVMLSVPLLQKTDVAEYIRKSIHKRVSTPQEEVALACPQQLGVYYYVDLHNTTSLQDDDVFIAILNTEMQSYKAEVLVNDISQGEIVILENKRTTLRSELITDWWRQGIKEPSEQTEEEEEQEEEQNQRIFYIDVLIEGCNETIASLTPTPPSIEYKSTTPAELGGGGGGGSRYSIDISKSSYEYFPD